jgi:hypothetical protein
MIPKATWTSTNLESAFLKQASSLGASCKKKTKERYRPRWDAQNPNAIQGAIKTNKRRKTKR